MSKDRDKAGLLKIIQERHTIVDGAWWPRWPVPTPLRRETISWRLFSQDMMNILHAKVTQYVDVENNLEC